MLPGKPRGVMSVILRWIISKFKGLRPPASPLAVAPITFTPAATGTPAVTGPVAPPIATEDLAGPANSGTTTPSLHRKRPFLFAARLRCVAKLNPPKGRKPGSPAIRPARKSMKPSPQLFPVKRQKPVAKRATTKIIIAKPQRKSAIIIPLPTGAQRAALLRAKRAA